MDSIKDGFAFNRCKFHIDTGSGGNIDGVPHRKSPEGLQVVIIAQCIGNFLIIDKNIETSVSDFVFLRCGIEVVN